MVGYDDLPESCFFTPSLTTVHNDFAGQAEHCIQVLLRLIDLQPVELPLPPLLPDLVVRESTAPVRRGGVEDGH